MKQHITILTVLLALILLGACDTDILTLENSGFYGVVRDADTGEPVSNATVYLNGPAADNTVTDNNGNYRFENIQEGTYTLSAEKERYTTSFVDSYVGLDSYEKLDIQMDYKGLLSTRTLDFGRDLNSLTITVTNLLDQPIEIDTDENVPWLTTDHSPFTIEPNRVEVINVEVNRFLLQNNAETTTLIVNIVEDFGFDVLESYAVEVNISK